jgi:hypothetical protein
MLAGENGRTGGREQPELFDGSLVIFVDGTAPVETKKE